MTLEKQLAVANEARIRAMKLYELTLGNEMRWMSKYDETCKELAAVNERIKQINQVTCIELEVIKECKQLLCEFQSNGEDARDILDAIRDYVAADKLIPEGEYESADGLEDVVRWLLSDRITALALIEELQEQIRTS
jgi:hypothetical protein